MPDQPSRLRLVTGDAKPKPYRARGKGDPEPLVCVCGSATFVETWTGAMLVDGKIDRRPATKQLVCYHCGTVML